MPISSSGRRTDDHRRLSLVYRLGTRHVHRVARDMPRRDRIDEARKILLEWSRAISEGMLPNRFPDRGEQPEFNAVDASLWFVIAVYDLFDAAAARGTTSPKKIDARSKTLSTHPHGLRRGTRFGIRLRRRRPARGRCPRGPAHVDGRQGRRPGHHASNRKAGRNRGVWLNALWLAGAVSLNGVPCSIAGAPRSSRDSGTKPPVPPRRR